jgi:hypothetical protein
MMNWQAMELWQSGKGHTMEWMMRGDQYKRAFLTAPSSAEMAATW